ncbi:acyltransferase [uncultured Xylophilus sp.]|uniref:acyltransferase family protein n=1 Tax=uncultured Xylophilus sp. TaxID=296832 RepID=UPI0025CDAE7A|nr:acyltransferase [uncultured Xylophilus sp.]
MTSPSAAAAARAAGDRLPLVDALKAGACLLIVAHHLAFYGPMSQTAHALAPDIFDWLADYARYAVQMFLAIGGFLAARTLAPAGIGASGAPWGRIARRYRRLVVPYAAALAVCIGVSALVRPVLTGDLVPEGPDAVQLLAHVLLLHDLFGIDALSAGVWYVAIDFQLFVLTSLLVWIGGCMPSPWRHGFLPMAVAVLAALSLALFNRDPALDAWAWYFFGAYGSGMLACWTAQARQPLRAIVLLASIGGATLLIEYRGRIAVALATALLLAVAQQSGRMQCWEPPAAVRYLGRISYAVFLIHFPVILLVAAVVHPVWPDAPWASLLGIVGALGLSVVAGALFHHGVEQPQGRWHRWADRLRWWRHRTGAPVP